MASQEEGSRSLTSHYKCFMLADLTPEQLQFVTIAFVVFAFSLFGVKLYRRLSNRGTKQEPVGTGNQFGFVNKKEGAYRTFCPNCYRNTVQLTYSIWRHER